MLCYLIGLVLCGATFAMRYLTHLGLYIDQSLTPAQPPRLVSMLPFKG